MTGCWKPALQNGRESSAEWLWRYITTINPSDQSGGFGRSPDGGGLHSAIRDSFAFDAPGSYNSFEAMRRRELERNAKELFATLGNSQGTTIPNPIQLAQVLVADPRNDFLRWWIYNVRAAAGFQADRAKAYMDNCRSNLGNVNAGTVAKDGVLAGLEGAAKGAARGRMAGPEGVVAGGALGGARGTLTGAGGSVISQACRGG